MREITENDLPTLSDEEIIAAINNMDDDDDYYKGIIYHHRPSSMDDWWSLADGNEIKYYLGGFPERVD